MAIPVQSVHRLDIPHHHHKYNIVGDFPLPPPPPKPVGATAATPVNRHLEPIKTTSAEDKHQALREHRCAQGLCFICRSKWFWGHKCAPTVHINVLQELYDLFPSHDDNDDTHSVQSAPDHHIMLHLSVVAVTP